MAKLFLAMVSTSMILMIVIISEFSSISTEAATDRLALAELMMSLSMAQAAEPKLCEVEKNVTQYEYSNFCRGACGPDSCHVNKVSGSIFCQCDDEINDSTAKKCSMTPPTDPGYAREVAMCQDECHNSDLAPFYCVEENVGQPMHCVCGPDPIASAMRVKRDVPAGTGPLAVLVGILASLLGPLGVVVDQLGILCYVLVVFLYGLL